MGIAQLVLDAAYAMLAGGQNALAHLAHRSHRTGGPLRFALCVHAETAADRGLARVSTVQTLACESMGAQMQWNCKSVVE